MTQLSPTAIKDALQSAAPIDSIQVQGWVRTRRDSKDFSFIELNDGSSLRNVQIIARNTLSNYAALQRLTTGASVRVTGALVASQGKGQKWELVADNIQIVGAADDSYPLQKKGHTPEFPGARLRLRSHAYHHRQRLRGRRRTVSRIDYRYQKSTAKKWGDRFRAGLLCTTDLSDCERSVRS